MNDKITDCILPSCFFVALWRGVGRTFSNRYKGGTGYYQLYNQ